MDFTLKELQDIRDNNNANWKQIGDPSMYGGVFESPDYPGKVVKIQDGFFRTYDNEIDKQMRAVMAESDMYEVPRLGETGFFPTGEVIEKSLLDESSSRFDANQEGTSFIVMDKADFAETVPSRARRIAEAKGLIDLYKNSGVFHTDTHPGNIKFNPKTNKAVILDYGLAKDRASVKRLGINDLDVRTRLIQKALNNSGNSDMLDLFNEHNYELIQSEIENRSPAARSAREDFINQGEDVALMVDQNIDPVRFDRKSKVETKASADGPIEILREGPQDFNQSFRNSPRRHSSTPSFIRNFSGQRMPPKNNVGGRFAAGAFGLAEAIPSPEVIRKTAEEGVLSGAGEYANEIILGAPIGAGVGLVTNAVPALGPFAVGAGGAAVLTNAIAAGNELTRQTTGESALSKIRQTIGTKERTGYAGKNASAKERLTAVLNQINNPPTVQRLGDNPTLFGRATPLEEMGPQQSNRTRRFRMASDRFNPSRLEFGLTELLFGR
jgi:hypothetical protein